MIGRTETHGFTENTLCAIKSLKLTTLKGKTELSNQQSTNIGGWLRHPYDGRVGTSSVESYRFIS